MDKTSLRLVNLYAASELPRVLEALAQWQVEPLVLRGDTVRDRASFYLQAAHDWFGDPGRFPAPDADAFADVLWGHLQLAPGAEFALVWTEVHRMLESGVGDLLHLVDLLTRVARQLYSPASPQTRPKTVYLILVGEGANFPSGRLA